MVDIGKSRGWVNLVRADVKRATDECMRDKRVGKDYCVLWWAGRAGNIPLHLVNLSLKGKK